MTRTLNIPCTAACLPALWGRLATKVVACGQALTQLLVQFIDWGLLPRALLGVLCLLCGNGYIVGINQIYDVDIDTVNKPFLPVAAGTRHTHKHPMPQFAMTHSLPPCTWRLTCRPEELNGLPPSLKRASTE